MIDMSEGRVTRRELLQASAAVGAGLVMTGCASGEEPAERPPTCDLGEDHHHGRPHDLRRWAEVLDDPARDAWQQPDVVVAGLAIAEGMVVADVGAGTGYFEPHLSRAVGARGRVLALDVDPDLVAHMQRRFQAAGLHNVEARLVSPVDPGLEAGAVDRVLIVDTWHHMSDRVAYAARLRRALTPTGRLVIVDYPADAPEGPPQELRLSAEAVLAELKAAGFTACIEPDALPRQYLIVAEVTVGGGR